MISGGMKKLFFDSKAVTRALDRGSARALARFGLYVQREDKKSLKYAKAPSAPGAPPTVHRSPGFTRAKKTRKGGTSRQRVSPLRELTYYGYDPWNRSVVIGPEAFRGSKIGAGKAPRVIEEGGVGPVVSGGKIKVGRYAPRPHTGPAFRRKLPLLPGLFKDVM
ncbi:MAG TPA: hypothetical protein VD866_31280 [Urbifossiella sp.]|nr:hypothetical protein [Urbifossiella sp.]